MRPDSPPQIPGPPGDAATGALPVLVVNDSPSQRRLLAALLRRGGYDVLTFSDADAALPALERVGGCVVICDWMMPGLSGPEFCTRVRAMKREDYAYIVILTSIQDKESTAHALDVGADDFLTKPVNTHELRARLRAGARVVEMQAEVLRQNRLSAAALRELTAVYDAIDRDLAQARQLQHALLPPPEVDFGTARAGFKLRSAGKVGGDLVGHFPAGPGRVGLFALDVSGHGVTSALLTARLAGMFSNASTGGNVTRDRDATGAERPRDPARIAAEINRRLLAEIETELYLTLCLAVLDLATGAVDLVQAGHPFPYHIRPGAPPQPVAETGMPVGLLFEADYHSVRLTLAPGDRLLLHSDGFVECPGPDGAMLGEEGLAGMLGSCSRHGPAECLDMLIDRLADFAGTRDFPDDVSALLLDYLGPAGMAADRRDPGGPEDRRGAP
ncbi:SpoIIE family protein phosphatase [Rhodobacterales bacterium HKCCE2091]|nr:SpoIIE family protein phosphatase [Rhodobacterales bacterium HKCCE2091]